MTYGKTLWMFFDENPREKNNIIHEQQGKLEDSVIYTYIYIIYSYIDSQAFFLEENSQIECFECFKSPSDFSQAQLALVSVGCLVTRQATQSNWKRK